MAAVTEGSSRPVDALTFVGLSLVLGIACRQLLRGTRVPYTVALLLVGIAMGFIEYGTHHGMGTIGNGIRIWAGIDPDLLLAVFLPALLFESSFSMELHQIKRCMAQMIILAGPGVLISTFCLGSALKLTFPYGWNWTTSLLLGGLLGATDPVAVVALLKELGASKKLSTIIEGESMMNDGVSIVVYQLFYQIVLGKSYNWASIIRYLSEVTFGAVGIALTFGIISVVCLGFIFNDSVIEITLSVALSYVAYFTAQESAGVSGILTVMTFGMFCSAFAKTEFKGELQQSFHHFWEMVAYIANTLIFIWSGVVIAEGVLDADDILGNGKSWAYLVLLYVYVQISRVIVVGVSFPLLRYFGYGLDWKEAIIIIWSGLRGAVSLSLSLSVKRTSESSTHISSDTGIQFVFFTGGIVFLTLVVNGSTTQFILHSLGMCGLSSAKRHILDYTKYEMLNKALEVFGDLGDDEELGPVDWPTVKKYITSLDDVGSESVHPHSANESDKELELADWPIVRNYIASLDGVGSESVHPHTANESDTNLDTKNLEDIRELLLNGVQAAYWTMLDEGRITESTANILMQSVNEAFDLVSEEPLCDWKNLKSHVHFPNYCKYLQTSICPQKLLTYFTVERLESACSICAAFLRAHRIARQQLHDFIGDSDVALITLNESEAEGEDAKKFLEDVSVTFPQVLRVVKTRQATHSVLNHLIVYLQTLEKCCLLEEKEMLHLHDAVQTDLKKLLRNPPLVKVPEVSDLINLNPLVGALPPPIRGPLEGSVNKTTKLRGVSLYKEGSEPSGIWLISTGVVKWTSKNMKDKHSLHPTFTHGSTLGLYEVLSSLPYICDIITDSVAVCFFIEKQKILSTLRSDPSVEEFLWQESAIMLVKLLLPQKFEKMAMQDLRALVAERSTMTIYIRGESFEIPNHSIGLLLEGFVKTQGIQEELITSPAPLLASQNLETLGTTAASTSFSPKGSTYLVETRSRVIVFNMTALESDSALIRRPSSCLFHAVDYPLRSQIRKHSGLMSWPEQLFKPKQQSQSPEGQNQQADSLSTRAMQLSIYGSAVNVRQRTRSAPTQPSQTVSYPNVLLHDSRPLVSVRSEGSSTMRKNLEVSKFSGKLGPPGQSTTYPIESHTVLEDSRDESGGEDLVIIRIDSPSRLSFHQANFTP